MDYFLVIDWLEQAIPIRVTTGQMVMMVGLAALSKLAEFFWEERTDSSVINRKRVADPSKER